MTTTNLDKRTLARIFNEAELAGRRAGDAHSPTPMHVIERANPFDDNSPIVKRFAPVMDGVCGFASIIIRPGTCQAARFAKTQYGIGENKYANGQWVKGTRGPRAGHVEEGKAGLSGHKSYYGGYELSVWSYGQSMERKSAYAEVFANVLRSYGIDAYPQSRVD